MNTWSMLFHIVRADFLERVRRSSFLIVLGLAAWLAFETYRGNVVLYVDNVRGEYNSAWLGALMTMVTTTFLSLFGFYVVKNAISRDVQTGVGEVLAATPMSKWMYIAGKTLSNCAVLLLMVAVLALGALAMRLAVGVGTGLDLWKLLAPFVFIALPTMALVAAIAIFFEVVPWLRGGLGNAAYFWVWSSVLAVFFISQQDDPIGFVVHMKSMEKALPPLPPPGHSWSLTVGPHRDLGRFHWDGIDWTGAVLLSRAKWVGIAAGLAAVAALIFDRFDPERRAIPKLLQRAERDVGAEPVMPGGQVRVTRLSPLAGTVAARFSVLVAAETRLLARGANRWWWLVFLAAVIVSAFIPLEKAHGPMLAGLWIWPLLLWATLGGRETLARVDGMAFSSPHPLSRLLAASWSAGFLLALVACSGVLLRCLLAGQWAWAGGLLCGAAFIPALAIGLGSASGSTRLFEVIYLIVWYLGPMNRIPHMDFAGVTPESISMGVPLMFLAMGAGLVGVAVMARRARIEA